MPEPVTLRLGVDLSQRRPLRDEVYLILRQAILGGQAAPGDRLIERELAEQLGISRSPVREALRRLEQEQLVSPGRQGVVVQGLSAQEVTELYVIRQQLESLVARLAARHCRAEHLAQLEAILAAGRAAVRADDAPAIQAQGVAFHDALAQIAGNRRLASLVASIAQEIQRYRTLHSNAPARRESVWDEHQQLVALIAAHDDGQAAQLMGSHIASALAFTFERTSSERDQREARQIGSLPGPGPLGSRSPIG